MDAERGSFREELNGVDGHGSRGRITFAKSRGWNFSVSLAEGVTGLVAGYAELRGEVAYRMQAPPRRQMSTKFLRMVSRC